MRAPLVVEYVNLCEQISGAGLFSKKDEQLFYDRLDQLWYAEMSEAERVEAQDQLNAKTRARNDARRAEGPVIP